MVNAELAKDIKGPPEVEFFIPKKIFMEHDSAHKTSILVQTFDFK